MNQSHLDASSTVPEMSQTFNKRNQIVSAHHDNPPTLNKHKCGNKATLVFVTVLVLGVLLPIFGYVFAQHKLIRSGSIAAGATLIVVASVFYYQSKEVRKRQQPNTTNRRRRHSQGRVSETVEIEPNLVRNNRPANNISLLNTSNNTAPLSSLVARRNNDHLQQFPMTVRTHEEKHVTIREDTQPPSYDSIVAGTSLHVTTTSNSNIPL